MRRVFATAAILALAVPGLALAQQNPYGNKGGGHPPAKSVITHAPAHAPLVHAPLVHGPVVHGPLEHHAPIVHGPVVHGPVVHGPVVHGPVVPLRFGGPIVGHGPWVFRGHSYAWHPVHFPHPWVYPAGYGYRLWAVGAILPPLFWSTPTYYYTDWADMGLPPPDPGYQYIQYGPDLLLVDVSTGEVVQVFPGAFAE